MLKRLIRLWKIERLARKLDPKAFAGNDKATISLAKERAELILATAEGQYDAIGWRPGRN